MLHWFSKPEKSKVLLSLLCLIHGLWFFKHVFASYWEDNFLLFLVVGPGKPIYAGAILLLYFQSFTRRLSPNKVSFILSLPTVYYLVLIFRFFLADSIDQKSALTLSIGFSLASLFIFWFYFFLSRTEIQSELKYVLIPRAYKRLKFLFYSLYFFLLQIPIWDICEKLVNAPQTSREVRIFLESYYVGFFQYVGYQASYAYIHILGYFIFFYALSELPYLKKLLLPKDTNLITTSKDGIEILKSKLEKHFYEEKAYLDPEITLDSCTRAIGVSRVDFTSLLKREIGKSFKDFVNELRVEEFKKLIRDESNQKFDLVGIASKCGFNSKATFFRVFKSVEGITPNEYRLLLSKKESELH